jgi:hypothetical protein
LLPLRCAEAMFFDVEDNRNMFGDNGCRRHQVKRNKRCSGLIDSDVIMRRYNPGLWTSMMLLIPFGLWGTPLKTRA